MCWHKWGNWKEIHSTDIVRHSTGGIIGYLFVQAKVCSKCGYTKIKEKRINAN